MAEVIREGQSVRVVLVDGETDASAPVVEKVRQALLEEPVEEVVLVIPSEEVSPDRPVVAELIRLLDEETRAKGVPLRFKV
jgi:hypothetical protein